MKMTVAVAAVCVSVVGLAAGNDARAVMRQYELNIRKQALDTALRDLAQQTRLQIALFADTVDGDVVVGPVQGMHSADEALRTLLAPSGLSYKVVSEGTIAVLKSAPAAGADARESKEKPSFWSRFRLAQVDSGSPAATESNATPAETGQPNRLEEIVVTAQKRLERLQDVPVPVSVISAETLVNNNLLRVQDYYNRVPGLNFSAGNRGELFLSIRGLVTGSYGNPTVGVVVDDVPYGSTTTYMSAPDLDPNELSSVEVLRGPQGTLYGASSLGGLLKYTTLNPSFDGVSGRIQAGVSSVENGDRAGSNVRGSVNVPLSETLALRGSAFWRRDPGYIDNPVRGEDGVNDASAWGGRVSLLWNLTDALSIKTSALVQRAAIRGSNYAFRDTGFADLQQDLLIGSGVTDRDTRVYNANVQWDLGEVSLTSITGYAKNQFTGTLDDSDLAALTQPQFGVAGLLYVEHFKGHKLSQEVRLASNAGKRVDWLVGAFYTKEKYDNPAELLPIDPSTGAAVGDFGGYTFPFSYTEYAGFADVTFHLSEKASIQIGARQSYDTEQSELSTYRGGFSRAVFQEDPHLLPAVEAKDRPFTYLVTPQLKITADLMAYARLATGFRPGGPNGGTAAAAGLVAFGPDKTQNYEIGLKGSSWHRALSYDVSLYRIDWRDIQLALLAPSVGGYKANAGRARSEGIEVSAEARPWRGMTMNGWVAYNDATLSTDLPSTSSIFGRDGDRLPYSSRYSGNLSLEQEFEIGSSLTWSLGGTLIYVGDRSSDFTTSAAVTRLDLPEYTAVDLRAALKSESWEANFTVNNVGDERGILKRDTRLAYQAYIYIQPRTLSLSFTKKF
jgi:outer membrane receptor protein involved in Fe transport